MTIITKTMSKNIPYDMLHELESIDRKAEPKKYNALLHKVHQKMGIKDNIAKSKGSEITDADVDKYEDEIVKLNNFGYTKQEIRYLITERFDNIKKQKIVSAVFKKHHLQNKPKFYYKVDDTYIQNLNTIRHWGFSCDNSITKAVDRLGRRGMHIVKHKYHWGELPKGAKYILKNDIDKVLIVKKY